LPPEVRVLRLKCMKYYFGWGFAPDPTGGIQRWHKTLIAGRGRPTGLLLRGMGVREGKRRGKD